MHRVNKTTGFALFEVLLGVIIFAIGVVALGRSAENCINASSLTAEENRARLILSNRMSEIQATPAIPDSTREAKIDTGYGVVRLIQKATPAVMTEDDGTELPGIMSVTLRVEWERAGIKQSKQVDFYVYRAG